MVEPVFQPRAAGCEARMLPLYYPPFLEELSFQQQFESIKTILLTKHCSKNQCVYYVLFFYINNSRLIVIPFIPAISIDQSIDK